MAANKAKKKTKSNTKAPPGIGTTARKEGNALGAKKRAAAGRVSASDVRGGSATHQSSMSKNPTPPLPKGIYWSIRDSYTRRAEFIARERANNTRGRSLIAKVDRVWSESVKKAAKKKK